MTTKKAAPFLREENGVFFVATSLKRRTGRQWLSRMKDRKVNVCKRAKNTLRFIEEPIGANGRVIAIIRVSSINDRSTRGVYAELTKRGLYPASIGSVCTLEDALSDEDLCQMGLWWLIGIHKPIIISGKPYLLGFGRNELGRSVSVCYHDHDYRWKDDTGFICEAR